MAQGWRYDIHGFGEKPCLSGRAGELFDLWRGHAGDDRPPRRRDIDVAALRPWLGRLMMVDVLSGSRDFRFTLVGTMVAEMLQADMTGELLSETSALGDHAGELGSVWRELVDGPATVVSIGTLDWQDRRHVSFFSLFLPLANDNDEVTKILGFTNFDTVSGAQGNA